jgi:hypothetical protein
MQSWRDSRHPERAADGNHPRALRFAVFGPGARPDHRFEHAVGERGAGSATIGVFGVCAAFADGRPVA